MGSPPARSTFPATAPPTSTRTSDLPVVSATREELLEVELAPFRAAIAAGTRAIMTAHLVVPAIDDVPATLSRAQLTGLLRDELGFTGTIVTDALEMKAVSATVGMEEGAVLALLAGADALCLGHDIDEGHVARVRAAIVAAVREGRLDESRLAEAAGRVAATHVPVAAARAARRAAVRRARPRGGTPRAPRPRARSATRRPLLVVELEGTMSVAAGLPSHDLASILGELGADVEAIHITESRLDHGARGRPGEPRPPAGRRRPRRRPPSVAAATLPRRSSPPTHGGVVVDVGYPAQSSAGACNGRITTFGVRARQPHGRCRAAARRTVIASYRRATRRL